MGILPSPLTSFHLGHQFDKNAQPLTVIAPTAPLSDGERRHPLLLPCYQHCLLRWRHRRMSLRPPHSVLAPSSPASLSKAEATVVTSPPPSSRSREGKGKEDTAPPPVVIVGGGGPTTVGGCWYREAVPLSKNQLGASLGKA